MLPLTLLPYSLRDDLIFPRYLTPRDAPWVRLLIDHLDALVGRTQGDAARILDAKVQEIAGDHAIPIAAVRAVRHRLERLWRTQPAARVPSRKIRRVVFELGKDATTPRDEVIRRAAKILGISAEQVSEGLFADSTSERRLSAPPEEPSPHTVIDAHNFTLAQEFLLRSELVVLHLGAHAAPVLRVAKQRGLMYAFALRAGGAVITLPGPASLSRQSLRYGRALADLLPAVTRVPDWSLEARCLLGDKVARFRADALDPIVTKVPKDVDNALERRLFRDFRRLGSRWSIARASEPLRGTRVTFFPDFTFERGMDRVHIELIGFHTADYVKAKCEALHDAGLSAVLLCVDDALACSEPANVAATEVFHFEKRVDASKLLRALDRIAANRDAAPDSDQPSS